MSGANELLPALTREEAVAVRARFGPSKASIARSLGTSVHTVDSLLDPYGRVARKVIERVRARLAEP